MPELYSQILDLKEKDVFLETEVNDSRYFSVTGLPSRLSYGKHPFSITFNDPEGQPLLKNLSNIVFEFVDSNDTVIFSDLLDIEELSGAGNGVLWIKKDPLRTADEISDGPVYLYVMGELDGDEIPNEWKGIYNVRSTFVFDARKDYPNTSNLVLKNPLGIQTNLNISESVEFDTADTVFKRSFINVSLTDLDTDGGKVESVELAYNEEKAQTDDYEIITTYPLTSGSYEVTDITKISGLNPITNTTKISTPKQFRRDTSVRFRLRFLNPAGEFAQYLDEDRQGEIVEVTSSFLTFESSPTFIEKTDNLLTGSFSVGVDVGKGFTFSGAKSAELSTVDYQGFTSASAGSGSGILMFSGSVKSDVTDDYSLGGVGLELVADSSSFFRFRTNPKELDIRANAFFIGSETSQFISGSSGDIEISSSVFHLDPANSLVSISGSINATDGTIGGWNIENDKLVNLENTVELNSTTPGLNIKDAGGIDRVTIKSGSFLTIGEGTQYIGNKSFEDDTISAGRNFVSNITSWSFSEGGGVNISLTDRSSFPDDEKAVSGDVTLDVVVPSGGSNYTTKNNYELVQVITASFNAGDTLSFSSVARFSSSFGGKGKDRALGPQYFRLEYSSSTSNGFKSFLPANDFTASNGYGEYFLGSGQYNSFGASAEMPEASDFVRVILTGSINDDTGYTIKKPLFAERKRNKDLGNKIFSKTIKGSATAEFPETELNFDNFSLRSNTRKVELTEKGLLIYNSEDSFLKMDASGIEFRGGSGVTTFGQSIARETFTNDSDVAGRLGAPALQAYQSDPEDIGTTAFDGNVGEFAKGNHRHRITSTTINNVISSSVLNVGGLISSGDITAENFIVKSTVTQITQSFSSGSTIFGDSTDDTHQFTGSLFVTSSALTIDSAGTVSGSSTSTGSFGAGRFAGKVGIGTTGPSAALHISETNDGGDTAIILNNNAGVGSTNETVSLFFTHTGIAGGKIVSGRTFNYSTVANRDSNLQFFTTQNATDTLALTLDADQNTIFAGNASGSSTSTASFGVVRAGNGINRFGNLLTDTHQFTGSLEVTGSFLVNGGGVATTPGSDKEVVFNDGGSLGSTSAFTFDKTTNHLSASLPSTASFGKILQNGQTLASVGGADTNVLINTGGVISGSNEFVYDDSTNRVGIGVSPSFLFHVQKQVDGDYVGFFKNSDSDNGFGVGIDAGDDANVRALQIRNHNGSAESFIVDGAGNALFPRANAKISGSATSTGSFGQGHFDGRVGIGIQTPDIAATSLDHLVVGKPGTGVAMSGTSHVGIVIGTGTSHIGRISFLDSLSAFGGAIDYHHGAGSGGVDTLKFYTDNYTQRLCLEGNKISGSSTSTGSFAKLITKNADIQDSAGNTLIGYDPGDIASDETINFKIGDVDGVTTGATLQLDVVNTEVILNDMKLIIPETIEHQGDADTIIAFANDKIRFKAGVEGVSQDLLHLSGSRISGSVASTGSFGNLTVAKDLMMSNGKVLNWGTSHGTLSSAIVGNSSTNVLVFYTNGSERARFNSSGNLGIGTSSPDGLVHAFSGNASQTANAAANQLIAENNTNAGVSILSGTSHSGAIYFGDSGNAKIGTIIYDHGDEQLRIGVNDAVILTLTDSKISGSSTSTGSFGAGFFDGNVGVGIDPDMTSFDRVLHVGGTNTAIVRFTGTTYSDTGGYVGMNFGGVDLFNQRNNYLRFGTNNTERMRISNAGKVGIGESQPTVALDVSGSDNLSSRIRLAKHASGTSKILQLGADRDTTAVPFIGAESNHAFDIITNNTQRVRIDTSGNVGIGTTSPSDYHSLASNLVVASSGDTGISLVSGTSSDGRIFFADGTSGGDESRGHIRYDHSDNSMHFVTNDAGTAIKIDSSGNSEFLRGNISGSSTSTGSFGRVDAHSFQNPSGLFLGSTNAAHEFSEITSTNHLFIGAGASTVQMQNDLIPDGDGSQNLGSSNRNFNQIFAKAKVTGSSTSTGSFGSVVAGGVGVNSFSSNVGVGLTSPETILHIRGAGDKFRVDASDGTQILQIQEFTGKIADIIGPGNKALRINHNSSGDVFIGTGGGSVMLGNTVANPASGFSNQKGFGFNGSTGQVQIASSTNTAALQIGKNQGTAGDLVIFRHESVSVGAIDTAGGISGSSSSTGSFGKLFIGNQSLTNTGNSEVQFSQNIQLRDGFELQNSLGFNIVRHEIDASDSGEDLILFGTDDSPNTDILFMTPGNAELLLLENAGSARFYGDVRFTKANAKISGSSTSTGSFGRVEATTITAPTLAGNTIIDGNLRTIGDITAENFIVSSSVTSITYQSLSGSTVFGDSSDDIHQFTGSLMVSASGLIGIGTNNPQNPIHIRGTDAFMSFTHETNGAQAGILYRNTSGTNVGFAAYNFSSNVWQVRTNNNLALTLDSAQDATFAGHIALAATKGIFFDGGSHTSIAESSGDNLRFQVGNSNVLDITTTKISGSFTSTGSFGHLITTNNIIMKNELGAPHNMFEFHDKNVAIQRAQGADRSNTGNSLYLHAFEDIIFTAQGTTAASQTERMRITEEGDVGIGTESPTALLHLEAGSDNATGGIRFTNDDTGGSTATDGTALFLEQNTTDFFIRNYENAGIRLRTNDTDALYISSGQKVGIGTTSPGSLLTIKDTGDISTSTFISGISGDGFRIKDNGSDGVSMEIDNITVRNTLRTHIFQKDVVRATNGILFISDSGVISGSTGTTSSGTVTFDNTKSATFSDNDILLFKDASDDGTINAVQFQINGSVSTAGDFDTYNVDNVVGNLSNLNTGGTAARISGGTVTIDASSPNSPFVDVNEASGSPVVRMGNLAGITSPRFGVNDEFGFWASGSAYLEGAINAKTGNIGGWGIGETAISSSGDSVIIDALTKRITVSDGSNARLFLGEVDGDGSSFPGSPQFGIKIFNGSGVADGNRLVELGEGANMIAGWDLLPGSIKSDTQDGSVALSSVSQSLTIWTGSINHAEPKLVLGKLPINDGTVNEPYGLAVFDGSGVVTSSVNDASASVLITANKARLAGWELVPGRLKSGTVADINGNNASLALGTGATSATGTPTQGLFFVSASTQPVFYVGDTFSYVNDVLKAGGWEIGLGQISSSKGTAKLLSDNGGAFALGSTPPTDYENGTGVFLSGSGQALFGNAAGSRVQWTGTALRISSSAFNLTTDGNLTASNGLFQNIRIVGGAANNSIEMISGSLGQPNFIGGGNNNKIEASYNTFLGGGQNNVVSMSNQSILVGGDGNVITGGIEPGLGTFIGDNATIAGGKENMIDTGPNAFIGGGTEHYIGPGNRGIEQAIGSGNPTIFNGPYTEEYSDGTEVGTVDGPKRSTSSTIGGGEGNLIKASTNSTIAGGRVHYIIDSDAASIAGGSLGKMIDADHSNILGGINNQIISQSHSVVAGGEQNKIGENGIPNRLTQGSLQARNFIGGGFQNFIFNSQHSTILGGNQNTVHTGSVKATILGGEGNTISSGSNAMIGGGEDNFISPPAAGTFGEYALIGTGKNNSIISSADFNVILGGENNHIGSTLTDVFVIGSNISASLSNTTFVESLVAQNTTDANDYVKVSHDGTDGNVVSNRGSLKLGSQGSANAITIDSNADVILKAGKKLFFDGSDNTYIFESSDGVIDVYGDNVHLISFKQNGTQSEVVVNEGSGDVDFRVEANNNQHAFFVEAEGQGNVEFRGTNQKISGSSTSTGSFGSLSLGESSHIHTLSIKGHSEGSTGIRVRHPSDDTLFEVKASEDDGRLRLFANNSRKIQLHANDVSYFNGGNVGIGTESPTARKLEVKDTSSNVGIRLTTGTSLDAIIDFGDTDDGDAGRIQYDNNTDKMHFRTSGSNRLTIDSSGNVTPGSDDSQTFGSSSERWKDIFAVQTTTGGVFETGLKTEKIGDNPTGTIVSWRGDGLVPCDSNEDELVMGVIKQGKDEPIVLGAEPVLVTGKVNIGDYIVTSDKIGHGKAVKRGYLLKKDLFGKVIAQALEPSDDSDSCLIKCMIRKM